MIGSMLGKLAALPIRIVDVPVRAVAEVFDSAVDGLTPDLRNTKDTPLSKAADAVEALAEDAIDR